MGSSIAQGPALDRVLSYKSLLLQCLLLAKHFISENSVN